MFVLKKHEKLVINRRRREEDQEAAAKRFGVSLTVYSLWERNQHSDVPNEKLYLVDTIGKAEQAFIMRRRGNMTQPELAFKMQYSEEWVKRMERNEVDGQPLFDYWNI